MSFILPEKINNNDVNDPAASLAEVYRYINYMSEQLDFHLRKIEKQTETLQAAIVSLDQRVKALEDA